VIINDSKLQQGLLTEEAPVEEVHVGTIISLNFCYDSTIGICSVQ
jgi:hypothetical protein